MNAGKEPYRVNFFRPKRGYMRDEVRITILILLGWLILTFGFQLLLVLLGDRSGQSALTLRTFFTLPFHFWFTGQFLPLWFIILCIAFNLCIDRLSESHSRRRDRSYD
ncbi:sodium/substrate symporter small subunit [Geotalea sp. SG265]|uniref:sodium/substrate symporter small subunit n=1 Tax=Geotalea sp. SG265 TaxID=2922867 RepID=UPI001FAEA116|nr:sodium/substrate symporter small subunit [Geotalea sp. SG265]